jgi:hypothetical protein
VLQKDLGRHLPLGLEMTAALDVAAHRTIGVARHMVGRQRSELLHVVARGISENARRAHLVSALHFHARPRSCEGIGDDDLALIGSMTRAKCFA